MINKTITARISGTSTVMSLTGYVQPGESYNVREIEINGRKAVLISLPIDKQCQICGEAYDGDEIGTICEKCETHINSIPGGI